MTVWVTLSVLGMFALGYRFYARWIGQRIFQLGSPAEQETTPTPAHTLADGRDYVATPKHILFGHHFTSIAGAAPIIGPCVAAYWGWLPALVWVVLGTLFIGAVHDFGALVASVRERGNSIAHITARVLSPRARIMFLSFVLVFVWLVLAVFAMAIASLFVSQPTSVIPVNAQILIALAMGWLLYKKKVKALIPSLVALVLLYLCVGWGAHMPLEFAAFGFSAAASSQLWIVLLFIYCGVASLLPVWILLQPRDYINSHQLFVGLALLFAGLFFLHPEFDAPAIRPPSPDAPSMFPLLFVTVACGAISGFHGLVSSGTTSKQLNRMGDARAIGYGSMLGEGTLALASTMAAVAGIALVAECHLPQQGAIENLGWHAYYDTWAHASGNKAAAFVLGGGAFLQGLGLSTELARTLMAVLVISFAATTLDTATRIQRFIVNEIGQATRARPLQNPYVATLIAVVPAAALALLDVDTGSGAQKAGWLLWPVFGISNQMLAALTFLVLTLYFASTRCAKGGQVTRRLPLPLAIPMFIVTGITLVAMTHKLREFIASGNTMLTALASLLLALQAWMLIEGTLALRRFRIHPGRQN